MKAIENDGKLFYRILHIAAAILQDPKTFFLSMVVGVFIGLLHHDWVVAIAPYSQLYLRILGAWVLPILFLSISLTAIKFIPNHTFWERIKVLGLLLVSSFFIVAIAMEISGKLLDYFAQFTSQNLVKFGEIFSETGLQDTIELPLKHRATDIFPENPLFEYLLGVIPQNIFYALSEGETVQVVFFAFLTGIFMGSLDTERRQIFINLLEGLEKILRLSVSWFQYLLPIAVCFQIATIFDRIGWAGLQAMQGFFIAILSVFFLTYLASILIVWQRSQRSLTEIYLAVKSPALYVLATGESLSAIPNTIKSLHESLHFDRETSNLIAPLAISIFRLGSVIYFSVAVLFVATLYNTNLSLAEVGVVFVGSMVGAIASVEFASGGVFLGLLAPILSALALPFEAVFVLLRAVEVAIAPFRELSTLLTAIAIAAILAQPQKPIPKHQNIC